MIRSDTHGCAVFFANTNQRNKALPDTVQLRLVGFVVILNYLKLLLIGIVSRVDADFLHDAGSYLGSVWRKMNIGYQWRIITSSAQFRLDVTQIFSFLDAGRRNADVFATRLDHPYTLLYRAKCVHRIHGRHGLHTDRMMSTHRHSANLYFDGFSALIFNQAGAIDSVHIYFRPTYAYAKTSFS